MRILAALIALPVLLRAQTETEVLNNAQISVDKYCSQELSELDRDAAYDDLQGGAGEDNFIYQAIREAGIAKREGGDVKELTSSLAEAADPGFIVGKAIAMVLLILVLIIFVFTCWCMCCPCCMRKCCACCQKKRTIGEKRLCQAVLWLLFFGIGIGSLVLASLTMRGYTNMDEGFSGTFCASAKLVQDSVQGTEGDTGFIGMLPAINSLESIADALNPDVPNGFMSQVSAIVDSTSAINVAFLQVQQSLKQLEAIVSNAENQNPTGMYHTCQICGPLATTMAPVNAAFESGIGSALKEAREQVQTQLQGQAAEDLRTQLQEAMAPVDALKQQLLEQVGGLVDPNGFQTQSEVIVGENSMLQPVVLFLFLLFFIVLVGGCLALGGFCWKHHPSEREQDPCCVRTCFTCVTCYSCIYAMNVLLLGGVLVLVAMVGSGVCMVLVDFNQELGEDLFASLGVEMTESMEMAVVLADRCLSLKSVDPDASRNLADLVSVTMGNGTRSTVRESIFNTAVDPIQEQFGQLDAMSTGDLSLSNMPELLELTDLIAALDMKALYLPSSDVTDAGSPYENMNEAFKAVSLACTDSVLSNDLPSPLGGQTVPGLDTMIGVLGAQGTIAAWSCPPPSHAGYTCTVSVNECNAGMSFIDSVKTPLVTQNKFKCIYQENYGNTLQCDPRNMVKGPMGWTGQCVSPAGVVKPFKVVDCSIAELEANLKNVGMDLTKSFEYFDDTVDDVMNGIGTQLVATVNQFIINPLENLLGKFDCSFMRDFWQGLTDGLCLRAMNGLRMIANSYVSLAVLSLLIAILMYVPWRFSRDNEDRCLVEGPTQEAVEQATI